MGPLGILTYFRTNNFFGGWAHGTTGTRASLRSAAFNLRGALLLAVGWALLGGAAHGQSDTAMTLQSEQAVSQAHSEAREQTRMRRTNEFLAGRAVMGEQPASPAERMQAARRQHLEMMGFMRGATPRSLASGDAGSALARATGTTSLSSTWQALGPASIASAAYGKVTGRITSVALDPSDASGNTVYLGTTGGGVWKSTNAAGTSSSVNFVPLTDTLPVFSGNAATAVIPSLSIGAVTVQPGGTGVVLAGTGDPNDALDSYYGTGLLRSADGGLTWSIIQNSHDGVGGNHSFVGEGFAGFAWSTTTPGLVVAALAQSARGAIVNASNAGYSVQGLYYSTDAGVTWQMSTIQDGSQVVQSSQSNFANYEGNSATAVVWNAVRQRFYAAVRFHGYYESADGLTWTRLANQPGVNLTTANCPVNAGNAGSPACPVFRGALAVQAQTGDLFALSVDLNNQDQGLWQDVCGKTGANCASGSVAFASQLNSTALEVGAGNKRILQGDYDLWVAALPAGGASSTANDTLLLVGTEDIFRCTLASGCSLRNTTNTGTCSSAKVAVSQHSVDFLPVPGAAAQPLLYFGNDGGLWRSTDGVNQQAAVCSPDDATHYQNLNGGLGSLAEVVSLAQHPSDATQLIVGVGSNGSATSVGAATATSAWPQLSTGEGGVAAIDAANPFNWYITTASGVNINQCTSGTSCTAANFLAPPVIGAPQVSNDEALLDAPYILDPAQNANLILGTCRVWRGPASGSSAWGGGNVISTMLDGAQRPSCSGNALIRSVAAGGPAATNGPGQNIGSKVIYAGMAGLLDGGGLFGGHLYATASADTANSSTQWTDISKSAVTNDAVNGGKFNPGGFDISSVTVDPHDATGMTVYATVMGFSGSGVSAPHVYRSSDGGAHWANISGNLPNAPANSLVVDPNDANTVYVALDTGVYATQQVNTCATATVNCWTVFGGGLPNAPAIQLAAITGGGNSLLRAATYGRGLWQIPLLTTPVQSGTPAMQLSPTSLTFGSQAVQTASAPQTITVTNTGTGALTISSLTTGGDFRETDSCISSSPIAPGLTCTVQVTFLPSATGSRTGSLTIYGNVTGGQATASLAGTAVTGASVVLTPLTLTFGNTQVGSASAVQNITVSNVGGTQVTLQTPLLTGDFKITANTCTPVLPPSVGCTVSITFNPTATGTRNGTFSITDGVGTQTAALSGTGFAAATDGLAPLALTFAPQQINTTSVAQQVTLTNNGDAALTLIAAQITLGDFTAVNGCGNSLAAHSSCTISVSFIPKNVGAETGLMTVSDEFRTQTVVLNGTGIAPAGVSLAPASPLNFGTDGVGVASLPQTVTLTNNGGVALIIQGLSASGDFSVLAGANLCPLGGTVGLASNASCTLQVVFAPTAVGMRNGLLTVQDNSPGSPQSMQLVGTGIDFQWQANGQTNVTVTSGQPAGYSLTLAPVVGIGLLSGQAQAAISCAGAPVNATCLLSTQKADLSGNTTVVVTVTTGVLTASLRPMNGVNSVDGVNGLEGWDGLPQNHGQTGSVGFTLLAMAWPLGLLAWVRRYSLAHFSWGQLTSGAGGSSTLGRNAKTEGARPAWKGMRVLGFCVVTGGLLLAVGCGSGRLIPGTGNGGSSGAQSSPTPSGTYNLTVTATYAGLTRVEPLTLVVQ